MRDDHISSPMELEATLLANDMRKSEKLWRQAEGKSLNKVHLFGLLGSYLLLGVGLVGLFAEGEYRAATFAILGTVVVISFVYQFQQRQIAALREIVRELSRRSS
jgi:hypothetical protein